MTPEQKITTQRLLDESSSAFLEIIHSIPDDRWKVKPAEDRWSVAEIAEHIVLVEAALLRKVRGLLATPPASVVLGDPSTLDRLTEGVAGRQGRVQAPTTLLPTGEWTKAEVMAKFGAHREAMELFVNTNTESLDHHTAPNAFFGTLTAFDWLVYGPLHTTRHIHQLREITGPGGAALTS